MSDFAIGGVVGNVGPASDGTQNEARLSRDNALVNTDGHGRYYEPTSRQQTFSGMTAAAGTTVVAANNTPVAAAAASVISLYNPLGSQVNLEVTKATLTFLTGTPASGSWVYNVAFNQNISATQNNGGVSGTGPQANYISGVNAVGKIYTQTALTGGTGAQILLRPLGASVFAAAIAASTTATNFTDWPDGDIVLPPGALLTLASPGTGTTLVVVAGFTWIETKIPQ